MKQGYIYKLIDPRNGEVRYIGQTIVTLKKRLQKHLSDSHIKNTHIANWVRLIINSGHTPIIEELLQCSIEELDEKEIHFIQYYKDKGCNLTNALLGGQSRRIFDPQTRIKISNSLKGKKQSKETRYKRSLSLKETWKSPELRELKRRQASELNRLGIIGTKGKPSAKKGKPFSGNKSLISESLKEYFKDHTPPNKIQPNNIEEIIKDYTERNLLHVDVAKKYGISRGTLTALMKRNRVTLRNNGSKYIPKETLAELRSSGLTVKQIATKLGCSIANVEKFLYTVHKKLK